MERRFHEALRDARRASRYPRRCDFLDVVGLHSRTYGRYESGQHLPEIEFLDQIIRRCGFSEPVSKTLRELHAVEAARRLGVEMRALPATLNVSELAERIQREVEYELKRAHVKVTSRTSQVCARRVEMLLKEALKIP